jgi:hypothetical protein
MNNELRKMEDRLTGIEKWDHSKVSNGLNDRKISEYSWFDIVFNMNDGCLQTDTAMIVTAWSGQLGWLKSTLASYRKTGAYVVLAYDNPFYVWNNIENPEFNLTNMPRAIHYLMAHSFVMKHKTYDADKRTGWFWNARYAQSILRGLPKIKYVYITNGDCILEKPEGFDEIKKILGDGDFMSGQSAPGGTIHTCDVIFKVEAFNRIMEYMFDRHSFTIIGSQSPECLLRDAVKKLELKETFAPKQPILPNGEIDYYCTQGLPSTWKDILGFINLYAEQEWRENNRLEPLDKKYFDPFMDYLYFRSDWRNTICKYYATGDKRYLMMWWDRGSDTDTERKFFELEHYGKDPILA